MNRTEALARVTRLGAVGQRPALANETVDAILDGHRIVDAAGLQPGETGYVDTFDWAGATAEVWATKAAMVAGDYNFTADDLKADKGDVLAHFTAMEAKYAALAIGGGPRVGAAGAGTLTVAGTNGPFDPVQRIADTVLP